VRELVREGGRTKWVLSKALADVASETERRVRAGEQITIPLVCSYGTERLWFEKGHWKAETFENKRDKPSRLDGYRDCLHFTIQESALINWIRDQESATRSGKEPIALRTVKDAMAKCVDVASSVHYDGRYKDLVVGTQLLQNLSDGQRIMLTLVGDLARRAATLNPHLEINAPQETPGVVAIDELDLHLHPRWQRHVIQDLKGTFPALQFVATTHSPQLLGEALPDEIIILSDTGATTPSRSFGIDSSRILDEVMHASPRNEVVGKLLSDLNRSFDDEDLERSNRLIGELEGYLGPDDPEVLRARTMMSFLESPK